MCNECAHVLKNTRIIDSPHSQCYLQAYFMLDELLVGGEIQESSKKNIIRADYRHNWI